MSDEEIKRLILARRAAFVAAAVAALAATECGPKEADPGPCLSAPYNPDNQPQVCLSPMPSPDASDTDASAITPAEPQVCLSPMPPDPPDASAPIVTVDASVADAKVPKPPPQPCLTPKRGP